MVGEGRSPLRRFEDQARLDRTSERELATFHVAAGVDKFLYRATAAAGRECLIDVDAQGNGGATCLDGGLFRLHRVAFLVRSEGGPDPASLTELYLIGAAAPGVAHLDVVDSRGAAHPAAIGPEGAFLYLFSAADRSAGVVPKSLVAQDGQGREIDRIHLGG